MRRSMCDGGANADLTTDQRGAMMLWRTRTRFDLSFLRICEVSTAYTCAGFAVSTRTLALKAQS